MAVYRLQDHAPSIASSAFIAPSADIIGWVTVGPRASVWYGAVLRGDIEAVVVGEGSNVQDGAVLHTSKGFACVLHAGVTVGHRALVHGATCEQGSFVGMSAIMLDGSRLERGAMLGAGALLPQGKVVPAGMLAVGVPARVVRPIAEQGNATRYEAQARRHAQQLQRL